VKDITEFLEQVNVDLEEAEGDIAKVAIVRDKINEKLDELKDESAKADLAEKPSTSSTDVPGRPGVPQVNATGTAQGGVV
jgi:hypothetical protein